MPYLLFPSSLSSAFWSLWQAAREAAQLAGIPVFALCVGLAFLIQWLVFIPAYRLQTEKFFDLTGSITYISVISIAGLLSAGLDARSILLWALVVIWAVRLGTFLFRRVRKAGKDDRFDDIKPSFIRFLNVWTIQGLWVTFTMAAALVAITTTNRKGLDIFAIIGFLVWVLGFAIESRCRRPEKPLQCQPGQQGKVHSKRFMVSLSPPQLFR